MLTGMVYGANPAPLDSLSSYYLQLKNLQEENAALLTPELFKATISDFKAANDAYTRKDTLAYNQRLDSIKNNITAMKEAVERSHDIFQPLFLSRQQAMRHGAKKHAESVWQSGEEYLNKAVKSLNKGKDKKAAKYAASAVEKYKLAEFQALKQKYLTSAITAVNNAKKAQADKWAPISFKHAINFMKQAESLIKSGTHNAEQIKKAAANARQEAVMAEYYAGIISGSADKVQNFEKILRQNHDRLAAYGALLGIKKDSLYRAGQIDTSIYIEIEKMVNERKMLVSEINAYENELKLLKTKIDSCKQKQQREQAYRKKVDFIKSLFSDEKAEVIITDNSIVLRLFDTKFISDNSSIPPEYFGLFSKVVQAVEEFAGSPLMISAHTDSRGSASNNKRISEKQAAAVKEFLLQNLENYEGGIDTVGVGEAQPIASNASAKGRAMNRRIEITIRLYGAQ